MLDQFLNMINPTMINRYIHVREPMFSAIMRLTKPDPTVKCVSRENGQTNGLFLAFRSTHVVLTTQEQPTSRFGEPGLHIGPRGGSSAEFFFDAVFLQLETISTECSMLDDYLSERRRGRDWTDRTGPF